MQTQLQFHFARLAPLFMQSCCTLHVCLNLSDKFLLQQAIAAFAADAASWPGLIYVQFNLNAQSPFNIKCKFNRACNRAGRCTLHVSLLHAAVGSISLVVASFGKRGKVCNGGGIKTANTPTAAMKGRKEERGEWGPETCCVTWHNSLAEARQIFMRQADKCMSNCAQVLRD